MELAYWRVPDRLLDEPEELLAWARSGMAAAQRVAAQKKPAAPRRGRGKRAAL